MKDNIKEEKTIKLYDREKEYEKIYEELKISGENEKFSVPLFTAGNIAALEGINFQVGLKNNPFVDLFKRIRDKNGYIAIGIPDADAHGNNDNNISFFEYACLCKIKNIFNYSDGMINVDFFGVMPIHLEEVYPEKFYDMAVVKAIPYPTITMKNLNPRGIALVESYKKAFKDLILRRRNIDESVIQPILSCDDLYLLVNATVPVFLSKNEDFKFFMGKADVMDRIKRAKELVLKESEKIDVIDEVKHKVSERLDKTQKEVILREQLKVINEELDGEIDEIENLKERAKAKKMPKDVEAYTLKEINKLKKMPYGSPEMSSIKNFLDTILELPFNEKTNDTISLKKAKEILDASHYGLNEVKDRILEYIAVMKRTKKLSGQILCFVGPPGIGKTSIVQSIARALNRNFVQISLGGVRDESLIRGHSRTYVGSRCGRILMGMKNAKTINPVFLLDEVDKLASDVHGDPASALLEVLDPEQNMHFKDNFLETEYSLSDVLFVATANNIENIPSPLLDRMEVIELSAYTEDEKVEIAQKHIIPKQLIKCGLDENNVSINEKALRVIISNYCIEAGVRDLERKIAQIFRKVVVKMTKDKEPKKYEIDEDNLFEYLGAKTSPNLDMYKGGNIGEAVGLAWTQVGGTTLLIETALSSGTGKLKFTGKLGDVFKESVELAMSVVKTKAEQYGIDPEVFKKTDVHIHLPEMAIGKDGPSAGITLTTALMSAFTHRPIKPRFVMTGEITLLGRVLPIGGLKEKMLAGIKVGATDVILPEANKGDFEKNKALVEGKLTPHFVNNIDEVLNLVLQPKK